MMARRERALLIYTLPSRKFSDTQVNVNTGKMITTKKSTLTDGDASVCVRELAVAGSEHVPQQLVIPQQGWVHGTPLRSIKWCPIETLVDSGDIKPSTN